MRRSQETDTGVAHKDWINMSGEVLIADLAEIAGFKVAV